MLNHEVQFIQISAIAASMSLLLSQQCFPVIVPLCSKEMHSWCLLKLRFF